MSRPPLPPFTAASAAQKARAAEDAWNSRDPADDDGDMLLFQWGTNDWGDGPAFEVNITRQLMVSGDEEEPRQLSLTFRFDPASAPKGLADGNKWCESPDQLAEYRRFVSRSKAFQAVGRESPASVELQYGRA